MPPAPEVPGELTQCKHLDIWRQKVVKVVWDPIWFPAAEFPIPRKISLIMEAQQ